MRPASGRPVSVSAIAPLNRARNAVSSRIACVSADALAMISLAK